MNRTDGHLAFSIYGLYLFYFLSSVLFVCAYLEYPGQGYIYVVFTIASNTLLYFGFRKKAIYFDAFIGVFFWLGFWLKLTVRVAFFDGLFHAPVGGFDGSGEAFDYSLLVTSCGFLGLLTASYLRERFVFSYPKALSNGSEGGLYGFYLANRGLVLLAFVILFVTVAATNAYYGIYQRGEVPRTILPYGLSGVYKWLLLFGLASFSALILNFELMRNKKPSLFVVALSLMEAFLTNVSLLSRGMVLNASALGYGLIKSSGLRKIKLRLNFYVLSILIFAMLFGCSVLLVNYMRSVNYMHSTDIQSKYLSTSNFQALYQNIENISGATKVLFLDRWVGIEGVMATSSYPEKGWELWWEAWKERYSDSGTSYYDMNLITSPYRNMDMEKYHFISLPGILAFCFYPGSFLFLFGCMFILGSIAAGIEISVFKLGGGNVILCALLAQVVAYRFVHFGYVPRQSYLLFGTLYLNLFLIYFSDKALRYLGKHKIL